MSRVGLSHSPELVFVCERPQLPEWRRTAAVFAEGDELLRQLKHSLPPGWLAMSNLEGELASVEQATTRKRADMNSRIPTLQQQITAAATALDNNVNQFVVEWERDRYVRGCLVRVIISRHFVGGILTRSSVGFAVRCPYARPLCAVL